MSHNKQVHSIIIFSFNSSKIIIESDDDENPEFTQVFGADYDVSLVKEDSIIEIYSKCSLKRILTRVSYLEPLSVPVWLIKIYLNLQ